jgi:hypothetical protein
MKRSIGFCFIVLLLICGNRLWAQEQAPSGFPGQKLVDELFARHQPDLLYVGLYFVPPPSSTAAIWPDANSSDQGGNQMVVVAATDRSTIGHKASCADMHVLTTDVPVLELNGDGGTKINGTVTGSTFLATFHDRRGNSIGLIDIGMKFTAGKESEAAKFARSVQRELEGEIRSKMAFFQHTQ